LEEIEEVARVERKRNEEAEEEKNLSVALITLNSSSLTPEVFATIFILD